jgi:exonuclease III
MAAWGWRINSKGVAVIRQHIRGAAGSRWDRGERQILLGLAAYDLPDISRRLHGYERQACGWYPVRKAPQRQACLIGRRFDHLLASTALMPESCTYLQTFRASGLSDHAALEAVFSASPGAISER